MLREFLLLIWLLSLLELIDSQVTVIYDILEYNNLYKASNVSSQDNIWFYLYDNNFVSAQPFDLKELNSKDRKRLEETGEMFVTFQFKYAEPDYKSPKTGIRIDAAPIFSTNSAEVRVEVEFAYFLFAFFKKENKMKEPQQFDLQATCVDYFFDFFDLTSMPNRTQTKKLMDSYTGMFANIHRLLFTNDI